MLSSKTSNHVKEKTFNIPAKILKDFSSSIQKMDRVIDANIN